MSLYRLALREEVLPVLEKGKSDRPFFVYVQSTKAYVPFVQINEEIPDDKRRNLLVLIGSNLFVEGELPRSTQPDLGGEAAFLGESLGPKAGLVLRESYKSLLDPINTDISAVTKTISEMSESILRIVAPEVGDVKTSVLQNLRNVHLMHHSAAITSLAILCGLANDFKSRTAFANLSHAVLLMDAAFASLDEDEVTTFYRNRRELPAHVADIVQNHPHRSLQLVSNLPMANDTVQQLILVHHELHNGKGYHRGIKTASTLQLGRVLAYAVDLYETLKSAELNSKPISLVAAIQLLDERGVEPHQRRHSAVLVKSVKDFLGLK